ncbi:MAG: class I SAM-dependent methyltransferase [Deltaproteobacteria bacterium]|nr:class I SAM-dependent methyltransferase [Deltaproteobacteria bacterium]
MTGERLDDASALYRADLERHRAAYRFAQARIRGGEGGGGQWAGGSVLLDLGCGTGYGAAELAAGGLRVIGLDRVRPAARARGAGADFVVGDLTRLPFADASVEAVVSFQVIEHFADPRPYLAELARILAPGGLLLVSTPNRLQSDGENPYHLHEYEAAELAALLAVHFEQVELRGVHAVGAAARHQAARLRQIRRLTRLDPFGLRRILPRSVVEWGFARLSLLVRRLIRPGRGEGEVLAADYPVGEAGSDCLDLLASCRVPRRRAGAIDQAGSD